MQEAEFKDRNREIPNSIRPPDNLGLGSTSPNRFNKWACTQPLPISAQTFVPQFDPLAGTVNLGFGLTFSTSLMNASGYAH